MLEITRRSTERLGRENWERIQATEDKAVEMYYDFLREQEVIEGDNYKIEIVPAAVLPDELKVYFNDLDQDCFFKVTDSKEQKKVVTTALGLSTKTGGQTVKYNSPDLEDETWDMDEMYYGSYGLDWFPALFGTEERPEYAELVERGKRELLDPETLPVVIGSEMGGSKLVAEGYLGKLTIAQFSGLLAIYDEVAYPPDGRGYDGVGSSLQHYFDSLKGGESVELRSAARHVEAAKHIISPEFDHDSREYKTFATSMYLNYNIPIGGIRLLFKEDLAMASEYTARATTYLIAEGIATDKAIKSVADLANSRTD